MTLTATRIAILQQIPEEDFRDAVVGWARHFGWLVYWTWSSVHSPAGFPDLVLCRPPRLIIAELKTQKALPPKGDQKQWLDALQQCAALGEDVDLFMNPLEVYLWRPFDEEIILGLLE